ncbi:MAG: alpha/beta hydrolase [Myxococcales bacterium]|nr:alpha/beta hydrolase [Myxococcales bacterium]
MGCMTRAICAASGIAALLFLLSSCWLGRIERSGALHDDLLLDGGVPATLYLPGVSPTVMPFFDFPVRQDRPPGVALAHGFALDRCAVSTLARRLAAAGYAVLTFDASGHGQSRAGYARSRARPDALYTDFVAAVDFLRASPFVDGERIAVAGHSMGAAAALDFATRDSGIDAAVMISGGWTLAGPFRPANALFLYADREPDAIRERSHALAARLAEVEAVRVGQTYGDPGRGNAVRVALVPDASHGNIVYKAATAELVLAWLDAAFGIERPAPTIARDPRWRLVQLAGIAFALVLPGLGVLIGRLLPPGTPRGAGDRGAAHLALAAALFAVLPLQALDAPLVPLPIEIGDAVASHFALAGIALLVWLARKGRLAAPLSGQLSSATLLGAGAALVIFALLLQPIGTVFHRMALTPPRALAFASTALVLLPFTFAFQSALRVGSPGVAALRALAGRVLVVAALVTGVWTGVSSWLVLAVLPLFVSVFACFELLAAFLYTASRNRVALALIEAGWLAFVMAAVLPMRA